MDNRSTSSTGGDTGKIIPFPGVGATNEQIEQSGAVFGEEEDAGEAFYKNGGQGVFSGGENGQNLMNAGPNYGVPIGENNEPGNVVDFATEIDKTLEAADTNKDGIVSASEKLEYMDAQGQVISKNLKKLTSKQTLAVEKDIDKQVSKGDAYGAVVSLQEWRDKLLDEAFGRHIGDRNAA